VTDGRVNRDSPLEIGSTSSTLLVRMRAKDPEAWRRFVYLYGPLVYHWCRRFGLREPEAADVGQEVFRTVSESIGGFRHEQKGDTFRGWLRTVTRTRTIDYLRRQAKGPHAVGGSEAQTMLLQVPESLDDSEPSDEDEKQILVRRVSDLVLENCKPENRQAFLRVVVAGEQPADVAADLGLTVNAVYLAKSHILRRIREEIAQLVDV
jgi:RNA polymerase sigma-70 factor (ECF subfamily)